MYSTCAAIIKYHVWGALNYSIYFVQFWKYSSGSWEFQTNPVPVRALLLPGRQLPSSHGRSSELQQAVPETEEVREQAHTHKWALWRLFFKGR